MADSDPKTKFKKAFTTIYEENIWLEEHSASGGGSDLSFNLSTYVPFLKQWLVDYRIESVVDLGCGDFLCGPYIYDDIASIEYTGYDTYPAVIEKNRARYAASGSKYTFHSADIFYEWQNMASADLCIIKDVLQHWQVADIYTFLDNLCLSGKYKYILICNCCDQKWDNEDTCLTGGFRQLSARFFPLRRYDAEILYTYHTKEVSLITCIGKKVG
jgi:Methyltransferase domain